MNKKSTSKIKRKILFDIKILNQYMSMANEAEDIFIKKNNAYKIPFLNLGL
jgi:hypothetical protein